VGWLTSPLLCAKSTCGSGLHEANPRRAPEVSLTARKSCCLGWVLQALEFIAALCAALLPERRSTSISRSTLREWGSTLA